MTKLASLRWLLGCAALLPVTIAAQAQAIPEFPPTVAERMLQDVTLGRSQSRSVVTRNQRAEEGSLLSSPGSSRATAVSGEDRKYFITDIGTLGGTESFAFGINDVGQVFGYSRIAGDIAAHAFLYHDGRMDDLGDLVITIAGGALNNAGQIAAGITIGGVVRPAIYDSQAGVLTVIPSLGGVSQSGFSGIATAINNRGKAVGWGYIDLLTAHAFRHRNGVTTDIGSFGGPSNAASINEAGTIVGSSTDASNGFVHAFVYAAGQLRDIDPFGDPTFATSLSAATDVNDDGKVVGYFLDQTDGAVHAFLYDGADFMDIGLAGSPEMNALAINDHDQVVGVHLVLDERICRPSCVELYKMHAFLYEDERIIDLNALIVSQSGWELTSAFDINSHGQIVGYGVLDDRFRAFLLTPVVSQQQCKKGGWRRFGFKNQGQCVQFART